MGHYMLISIRCGSTGRPIFHGTVDADSVHAAARKLGGGRGDGATIGTFPFSLDSARMDDFIPSEKTREILRRSYEERLSPDVYSGHGPEVEALRQDAREAMEAACEKLDAALGEKHEWYLLSAPSLVKE